MSVNCSINQYYYYKHGVHGRKYLLKSPGNAISETLIFKMSQDAPALKKRVPLVRVPKPGSVVHSMIRYLIIYEREAVLWCNKYIDTP